MNSTRTEYELLVSQRKNRKNRRKSKGRNVVAWEKLRESGVVGIDTLSGGGLVSAPIAGKALPRIARRIFRRAARFEPKPIDADKDFVVQEGTEFERPAPPKTPTTPVKPNTPSFAVRENKTPWGGAKKLIKEQRKQTKKFQSWASSRDWKRFHREHFDWWTFPIDRGSMAYGYEFTPPQEEIAKLKNNIPYIDSLRRAASLYLRSMAWDLNAGDWINNPDFDRGQEPLVNINQARLFKIGRSMQIHGLNNEFVSVRRMIQSLRDAGAKVGYDEYWDNPHIYKYQPLNPANTVIQQTLPNPESPISGTGISGRMGVSYTPKNLSGIDGKEQRFGIENEPEFRKRYDDLDNEVESDYKIFMSERSGKQEINALYNDLVGKSNIENFYWKDDKTRIKHAEYLDIGTAMKPAVNQRTKKLLRTYAVSPSERKKKLTGVNKDFGRISRFVENNFGWVMGTKSNYPAVYDLASNLGTTASTPTNVDIATANTIQNFLGHLDKYLNPTNYHRAFEEWIRNPRITGKDKKGNIVGIRLALENNRAALIAEFDRRIGLLKDEVADTFSIDRESLDRKLTPELEARKYVDELQDGIRKKILEDLKSVMATNAIDDSAYRYALNLNQVAEIVADRLRVNGLNEKERGFNGEVLKLLLEQPENLPMLGQMKRDKPRLFESSVFDSIPADDLAMARQLLDLHIFQQRMNGQEVTVESARDSADERYFSDELLSALITERQTMT